MADPVKGEFARRRTQLMRLMGNDAIAILPAAPPRQRNNDVEYNFRQDSDFYYLSGFNEPDAVAVLIPGRELAQYILFVRERDREREIWDGKRAGPAGAVEEFGADDSFPITDIDEILPGLMEKCSRVYYTMGLNQEFDQRVVGWVNTLRSQARNGAHPPQEFVALDHVLHDMRLFKSRGEQSLMRRSGQIAARAHVRAMQFCRPGRMEYEVMAELLHEFNRNGADISYYPIVGGGANSCVLHYRDNSARLNDGDLLLVDAGRSEERRVGKECRSLCDWSSDVCSSDLLLLSDRRRRRQFLCTALPRQQRAAQRWRSAAGGCGQIGRASCRERV